MGDKDKIIALPHVDATARQRLAERMRALAVEFENAFDDDIDTLRALREHYTENVKLFFITGADAVLDLATWHDAEAMAKLATFIAATRPGYDIEQARKRLDESGVPFDVRYIEIPALAISSTNIRQRVQAGKSVRYLTSESVIGYIRKNGLYNVHRVERVEGTHIR